MSSPPWDLAEESLWGARWLDSGEKQGEGWTKKKRKRYERAMKERRGGDEPKEGMKEGWRDERELRMERERVKKDEGRERELRMEGERGKEGGRQAGETPLCRCHRSVKRYFSTPTAVSSPACFAYALTSLLCLPLWAQPCRAAGRVGVGVGGGGKVWRVTTLNYFVLS